MTVSRQTKILDRAILKNLSRRTRMRSIRDVMQRRVTKRFPLYDDAILIKKKRRTTIASTKNLLESIRRRQLGVAGEPRKVFRHQTDDKHALFLTR